MLTTFSGTVGGQLRQVSLYMQNAKLNSIDILHYWQMFAFSVYYSDKCQSHWPHGLRRRSAAASLLRLWVRIPPGALSFVSVVCVVR